MRVSSFDFLFFAGLQTYGLVVPVACYCRKGYTTAARE
jgi:hypothetical protein